MIKNSFLLVVALILCAACSSNKTETTTEATTSEMAMATKEMPATVSTPWRNATAAYLNMKDALVSSDLAAAKLAAVDITSAIAGADMSAMGDSHNAWMEVAPEVSAKAAAVGKATDIEAARTAFYALSEPMVAAVKTLGEGGQDLFVQYCPMAFDNAGANWLASEKEIRNPYFGDKMLTCGKVTEEL